MRKKISYLLLLTLLVSMFSGIPTSKVAAEGVTGVKLDQHTAALQEGGTIKLDATVLPETTTDAAITWSSSDDTVAEVDDTGKVTGVKAGEAAITVTTEEGGYTDECTVTVKANTIADGLIAKYPLLEDVKDITGNGNDGTTIGAITYEDGLTLPGGETDYVELPGDMFVNEDNLTISAWIKNEMNPGNYSALFFGTAANSNGLPENYWIFNPSNPDGNFKTVFTNSVSSGAPWGTEVGPDGSSTSGYQGKWVHYTTVITSDSITGYIDGELVGTANKTRTTSDFGENIEAYIGRSNYLSDPTFKGSFQDLRIYGIGLDAEQVEEVYTDSQEDFDLNEAAEALTLPKTTNLIGNIELPTSGINGVDISWSSSNPEAISNTGVVTLAPEAQTAVLTATIELNGKSTTREFMVSIAAQDNTDDILLAEAAEALTLPKTTNLTGNIELPSSGVNGTNIIWSSSNPGAISDAGVVTLASEAQTAILTATIELNEKTTTKEFTVTIAGEDDLDLLTDLYMHYKFNDDSSASTIEDSSENGNNGTIEGIGASIKNGVLTLPGGNSGSDAAYVELPTGMFDGQDILTVTTWLKNETGASNYAAMFFGTTESLPAQYWLFNPCNPSGYFKSVITNEYNSSAPYNTEYGISPTTSSQGINGPKTDDSWAFYTTVIEPTSITAYYNGELVGTVGISRKVSDFGSNLAAYIGKSSYPDIFFQGKLKDVKVYTAALTETAINVDMINTILSEDKELLELLDSQVISDISLPATGENGSAITWESSNPTYIKDDGTVTRPEEGKGNQTVILTATLNYEGSAVTKDFSVEVIEDSTEKNLAYLREIADEFDLGISYVTEDIALPATAGENISISWTTSDDSLISAEGKVNRPEDGDDIVTLTAVFQLGKATAEKNFTVTVAEAAYGYLLSYIVRGNTDRTDSLHIAYSQDGENYTALHNNQAILYTSKGSNKMGSPTIFRKSDGTYGLIATDDNNSSFIIVFDSEDLLTYTNERYVEVNAAGINVENPICYYDTAVGAYRVDFEGPDGKSYTTTTTDFERFTDLEESEYIKADVDGNLPADAIEAGVLEVTESEYNRVMKKYDRVVNTGIEDIADVEIKIGGAINLPEKVTATYSDGSTKDMEVVWSEEEINTIDMTKEGTYTITGIVQQTIYDNPLIEQRADPCITLGDDGYYYFTASYPVCGDSDPEGYDRVVLRRARTIEGLADAEEITLWDEADSNTCFRYIWAPEIRNINGKWYVFCTASLSSSNVWDIRPHILACEGDGDPHNPDNWVMKGPMQAADGDTSTFAGFSLDMTCFENNGEHYVVWAGTPDGASSIYMATIDPEEPWQLTSDAILMTTPEYAWEWKGGTTVNEGPVVLKHDGKIYLCYSAAAVDESYCVGMLSADADADLMDTNSWAKNPYPLLTSDDLIKEYGPGHNTFTTDAYGNTILVYHARPEDCYNDECDYANSSDLNDPCRHARVKNVNFAADGSPVLNMTYEEELAEAFKTVSMKVRVSENGSGEGSGVNEILHYDMNQVNGNTVYDRTGNGHNGTLYGEPTVTDEGVEFDGSNDYIQMPDGLLSGLTDISISVDVYVDPDNINPTWIYSFGSSTDPYGDGDANYLGLLLNDNQYRTMLATKHWTDEQSTIVSSGFPQGIWKNVIYTQSESVGTLYVDGEQVAQNDSVAYAPQDIEDTIANYLAKPTYKEDKYFVGKIKDFRLFDGVLSDDQIQQLGSGNEADTVQMDKGRLTLGDISAVTEDLDLPIEGTYGSSISWASSNEFIINPATGKVTRPASDEEAQIVTLTATISKGNVSDIKTFEVTVIPELSDSEKVDLDLGNLIIHNIDDVRGNLTLPVEGANGSGITWESADPSIITTTGEVTRPAYGEGDVKVALTATVTSNDISITKSFEAFVREMPAEEEYTGYAFTYFTGEGYSNGEQIYFALSDGNDPLHWNELNDGNPVFTSELGEKGVRDPFIIRSPEGDKFYLIATDLKIHGNGDWTAAQTSGSLFIMVWESTDLVHWSNQRMVQVSPEEAGCTWAPEAFYDKESGYYVVFWASKLYENEGHTGSSYHRIMFAKTRDFYTFTEPQVYMDYGHSIIDTTMIENDGRTYRITKDERSNSSDAPNGKFVFQEVGDSVFGDFNLITEGIGKGSISQGEGPTIFKANGEDKWYLLIDENGGRGYVPFETTDLDSGEWTMSEDYELPDRPRHGTVVPITKSEYEALSANVPVIEEEDEDVISVTGVSLDKEKAAIGVGETTKLEAAVIPENATNQTMTWSSSDEAVAEVDQDGNVRGISEGTANITVTTEDGKYMATCIITVTEKPFVLITDGKLDRTEGIRASVKVDLTDGAATHTGTEVVLFQLMKGNTPVSIIALQRDITSQEEFTAYFNVNPTDTSYFVRTFVLDSFSSDLSAPISLAEQATLN